MEFNRDLYLEARVVTAFGGWRHGRAPVVSSDGKYSRGPMHGRLHGGFTGGNGERGYSSSRLSCRIRIKIRIRGKIKIKGGGQECPPHTDF